MKTELTEFRISMLIKVLVFSGFVSLSILPARSFDNSEQLMIQQYRMTFLPEQLELFPEAGKQEVYVDPEELECMTKNIYFESAHEGFDGKVAVATVTMNRVKSGRYPDSVCDVVYQRGQFSWTKHRKSVKNWKAYRRAEDIAYKVLSEELESDLISRYKNYKKITLKITITL